MAKITDEYEIQTNPDVPPSVQPPHNLPIALQQTVKIQLKFKVNEAVIAPGILQPHMSSSPFILNMSLTLKMQKARMEKQKGHCRVRVMYP